MWGVAQLVMRHVEKRYVQSPSISVQPFPALTAAFILALAYREAENFTSLTKVYSPLNQIGLRFGQDRRSGADLSLPCSLAD